MTLSELLRRCQSFNIIFVAGAQRSGTTICSNILAKELNYALVDEHDYGVDKFDRLCEILEHGDKLVIQSPALFHQMSILLNTYSKAFAVIMRRNREEIINSQDRIGWTVSEEPREKSKYRKLDVDLTQPISQIKYEVWDNIHSKVVNKEQWSNFNYNELKVHNMFLPKEKRINFHPKQIQ